MTPTEAVLLSGLANAAWQAVVVAVAAIACTAAARRARAAERHVLWVLALGIAAFLPLRSGWMAASPHRTVLRTVGEDGPGVAFGPPVASLAAAGPESPAPMRVPLPASAGHALVAAYLTFVSLRLAGLVRAWRQTRLLRRHAFAADVPPHLAAVVEECRMVMGTGPVPILVSPFVETPVAVGVLRPAILLPSGWLAGASAELTRAVIGHELAHVRRRDFAVHLLCEIVALPLSFHPAMTLIRRHVRRTREQACDERVTAALVDRKGYASALLAAAQALSPAARLTPALGLFDDDSFEERVMRVLDSRSHLRPVSGRLLVATAAVVLGLLSTVAATASVTVVEREPAGASRPPSATAAGTDALAAPDSDPPAGEYAYVPGRARDPFLDPRFRMAHPTDVHDPRGFLIQDIALRGVVKRGPAWTAMILGPDGRTYFVSAGQRFFDGTLAVVDAAGLTFQQQVRDPLAPPRVRDLRLPLHPED